MEDDPIRFTGVLKKIQLVSCDCGFGPMPGPDEEAEQRLTLTADGRVWLSRYRFGEDKWKPALFEKRQIALSPAAVAPVMEAVSRLFAGGNPLPWVTDAGIWELTLTNEQGQRFWYRGSLVADRCEGTDALSDMIRAALGRNDLFVFDGNPDRVERIELSYHRYACVKAKNTPPASGFDQAVIDHREHLVLDRAAETVRLVRDIAPGCKVTLDCRIPGDVARFLDGIRLDAFSVVKGNPPDVIDDPKGSRDYALALLTKHGIKREVSGSYDRDGLPTDWAEFIEGVFDLLSYYDTGEIFSGRYYAEPRRRKSDLIFCHVALGQWGSTYSYLAQTDDYAEGDWVVVPVGHKNRETLGRIESITYRQPEDAPYPLDKIKTILRKSERKKEDPA